MPAGTRAVPCVEQEGGHKQCPPPRFPDPLLVPQVHLRAGKPSGSRHRGGDPWATGRGHGSSGAVATDPGGNQAGPAQPPPPRLLLLLRAPGREAAPSRAPRSRGLVLPLLLLPLFLNPSYKTMRGAPAPQLPIAPGEPVAQPRGPRPPSPCRAGQQGGFGKGCVWTDPPPRIQPLLLAGGRGAAG